ncbi:hypothetical protein BY996DRAFT_811154 [Phakopsora pachyrhizi]|nr:hypothetical protein BY996DRAFT_811154 [Phakopsora pachyrhizi]
MAYSLPPSDINLQKKFHRNRGNGVDWKSKLGGPLIFNSIFIAGYLLNMIPTAIFITRCGKSLSKINKHWKDCDQMLKFISYSINVSDSIKMIKYKENLLNDSQSLVLASRELVINLRCLLGIFVVTGIFFFIGNTFCTTKIIRALSAQIKVFRSCAQRRKNKIELSQRVSTTSKKTGVESQLSAIFQDTFIDLNLLEAEAQDFWSWKTFLPSLRPGTRVTSMLWQSNLFDQPAEDWEKIDSILLTKKYSDLKRFTTNTLWQSILANIVAISYIVFDVVFSLNAKWYRSYETLGQALIDVIIWCALTWNFGPAILLGLVSYLLNCDRFSKWAVIINTSNLNQVLNFSEYENRYHVKRLLPLKLSVFLSRPFKKEILKIHELNFLF